MIPNEHDDPGAAGDAAPGDAGAEHGSSASQFPPAAVPGPIPPALGGVGRPAPAGDAGTQDATAGDATAGDAGAQDAGAQDAVAVNGAGHAAQNGTGQPADQNGAASAASAANQAAPNGAGPDAPGPDAASEAGLDDDDMDSYLTSGPNPFSSVHPQGTGPFPRLLPRAFVPQSSAPPSGEHGPQPSPYANPAGHPWVQPAQQGGHQAQPHQAQPHPDRPYPAQPYRAQPYPAQPHAAGSYPGQLYQPGPYPDQANPYPDQPGPHPGHQYGPEYGLAASVPADAQPGDREPGDQEPGAADPELEGSIPAASVPPDSAPAGSPPAAPHPDAPHAAMPAGPHGGTPAAPHGVTPQEGAPFGDVPLMEPLPDMEPLPEEGYPPMPAPYPEPPAPAEGYPRAPQAYAPPAPGAYPQTPEAYPAAPEAYSAPETYHAPEVYPAAPEAHRAGRQAYPGTAEAYSGRLPEAAPPLPSPYPAQPGGQSPGVPGVPGGPVPGGPVPAPMPPGGPSRGPVPGGPVPGGQAPGNQAQGNQQYGYPQPAPGAQQERYQTGAAGLLPPAETESPHPRETADSLTAESLLHGKRPAPGGGWRRTIYRATGGLIRVGESAADLRRRDLVNRVRTPVAGGHHRVAVMSLKGGVGKTTTTVGLGATLATLRGDRVIAVDGNPDRGTLSDKVRLETAATVRDLLNERAQVMRYADVRAFTSQASSRLEVLASDRDPAVSVAFSADDYRDVARVLEHYYSICITDCGTGLLHSAMSGILEMADQIVLVSSASVDGARSASATLDWLDAHNYGDLVRSGVVVLSAIRQRSKSAVDLDRLEAHFAARCRAVVRVPYDSHLEEGAEVELELLNAETTDAYLALAALVADGFATPRRAAPRPV